MYLYISKINHFCLSVCLSVCPTYLSHVCKKTMTDIWDMFVWMFVVNKSTTATAANWSSLTGGRKESGREEGGREGGREVGGRKGVVGRGGWGMAAQTRFGVKKIRPDIKNDNYIITPKSQQWWLCRASDCIPAWQKWSRQWFFFQRGETLLIWWTWSLNINSINIGSWSRIPWYIDHSHFHAKSLISRV